MAQRCIEATLFSALSVVLSASWVQHAKADNEYVLDAILCTAGADPGGSADCVGPQGTIVRWDQTPDACSYSQHWVGFDGCEQIEGESGAFLACNWTLGADGNQAVSGPIQNAYDFTSPNYCDPDWDDARLGRMDLVCGCATPQST